MSLADQLTPAEMSFINANLSKFTQEELVEINEALGEIARRNQLSHIRNDLIAYCKYMNPDFIVGKHHRVLADMLMALERGDKDRAMVNMPPRHGKSHLVSEHFPAWYMGRNPNKKLMMVSHTSDLAVDFGRKVRNSMATSKYADIFPSVTLAKDSKSAGRWNTNHAGEYYACGVGSALAGRGADLLLIDDPHSEQDVLKGNFEVFEKAYAWFTMGARTRLMPGGAVAIVQTRWHMDDLTGQLLRDMAQAEEGSQVDQYEVVEFPAILEIEDEDSPEELVQKPLWPEWFDLEALHRIKDGMPLFQWNAQYQQDPTSEEGSIIKREWWKEWTKDDPPLCEYVITTLDAAAEKHNRADFTAITSWGVFMNEETDRYNLILLDAVKDRVEFYELKQMAMQIYNSMEPDAFIVEKKSSGVALYQELRRTGVPVQEYTPHRGSGDKFARLNSVSDIVREGLVWVPRKRWAEEVVEEVAGFPFMPNDDLVDTVIMALMRFRQGGFLRLPSDEPEEQEYYRPRVEAYY